MRCQTAMVINCPAVDPSERSDLDDRTLAANGRARSDGEGRGERFYGSHDRPDDPFLVIDCIHDFRYAMAASLGCKILDEKSDNQPAKNRDKNHIDAPGARGRVNIGIVKE